jgi:tetratricopeptide (TPR) repeat protein
MHKAGDHAKSQGYLAAALRALPDFSPALLMNARLKASESDLEAALALVDRVLANEPGNYEALQLKGDLLLARGDTSAALEAQRQAVSKRPDGVAAHSAPLKSCSCVVISSRRKRSSSR